MRAMHATGEARVQELRTLLQKASICVAVGRLNTAGISAALEELPVEACAAFVASSQRIEAMQRRRRMLADYAAFNGDDARTPPPMTASASADPKDPTHSELVAAVRALGEAVAVLLAPHLSGKSIQSFEALVDFWCTPAYLEAFWTSEAIEGDRELMLAVMTETVADS